MRIAYLLARGPDGGWVPIGLGWAVRLSDGLFRAVQQMYKYGIVFAVRRHGLPVECQGERLSSLDGSRDIVAYQLGLFAKDHAGFDLRRKSMRSLGAILKGVRNRLSSVWVSPIIAGKALSGRPQG